MPQAYWYAGPSDVPAALGLMLDIREGEAGERFDVPIVIRVTDAQGVAVTNRVPRATVVDASGELLEVERNQNKYPGYFIVRVKLRPDAGAWNSVKVEAGAIERTIWILGTLGGRWQN